MKNEHVITYPPLNTLKSVAENIWLVDGPIIRFGMPWPKLPFPTRMTVIRLPEDRLFIHSPTPLVPELRAGIEAIGTPRWIIGPNRIHYWWIPEWRKAFPKAQVYLAPRIKEQARGRIDFDSQKLTADGGYPRDSDVATLPISGSALTEVEFFHYSTRTLILTDLVANFEASKLPNCFVRWATWLAGVQDPDGQMGRDRCRRGGGWNLKVA